METDEGILDLYFNPFANNWDWINQNFGLTEKRAIQLSAILGKTEKEIKRIRPINYGNYVAFVAIRWGFAKLRNGVLIPTEKWTNRNGYNEFGQAI